MNTITDLMYAKNFAEGGFRDIFMATSSDSGMPMKWVIQKVKQDRIGLITSKLNLTNL